MSKKRSKKTIETQTKILNLIQEQIGLKLEVDDYFNQITRRGGERRFNVDLKEKCYFSNKFQKLKRLAAYSDTVYHVAENGKQRVAIYFK